MSRVCTICSHEQATEIDKALIDGTDSNRTISNRFNVSKAAVQRHKIGHIPQILAENMSSAAVSDRSETKQYAEAKRTAHDAHALDLFGEFIRQLERVNKLSDAVDRWLQDPEDPDLYSIDPRAADITVVYEDFTDVTPSGAPKKKKESLAALLAQIDGHPGWIVQRAETHIADPRELLLKAAGGIDKLGATISGVLDKAYNAQEEERFRTAILTAIAEVDPDVRQRVIDHLQRRGPLSPLPR